MGAGESICIVCSPRYLEQAEKLKQLGDIPSHTLLHLDAHYPQRMDWQSWLEYFDIPFPKTTKQSHYTGYSIVLQAALEGQGLALGWKHIITPLLTQGRLVKAVKNEIVTGNPFHIIAPSQLPLSPAAVSTRDWLIEQL